MYVGVLWGEQSFVLARLWENVQTAASALHHYTANAIHAFIYIFFLPPDVLHALFLCAAVHFVYNAFVFPCGLRKVAGAIMPGQGCARLLDPPACTV